MYLRCCRFGGPELARHVLARGIRDGRVPPAAPWEAAFRVRLPGGRATSSANRLSPSGTWTRSFTSMLGHADQPAAAHSRPLGEKVPVCRARTQLADSKLIRHQPGLGPATRPGFPAGGIHGHRIGQSRYASSILMSGANRAVHKERTHTDRIRSGVLRTQSHSVIGLPVWQLLRAARWPDPEDRQHKDRREIEQLGESGMFAEPCRSVLTESSRWISKNNESLTACRSRIARDAPGPGTEQPKIFSRNSPESPEGEIKASALPKASAPDLVFPGPGWVGFELAASSSRTALARVQPT